MTSEAQTLIEVLSITAVPYFLFVIADFAYIIFGGKNPSINLETPKSFNKYGRYIFALGHIIMVAYIGVMIVFNVPNLFDAQLLFYLIYFCTILVAIGAYLKNFNRSDSSKSIKLLKFFGHLLLAAGLFLLFQFIVSFIILQDTGKWWPFICFIAIIVISISVLLLFNAYKKRTPREKYIAQIQPTLFNVIGTEIKDDKKTVNKKDNNNDKPGTRHLHPFHVKKLVQKVVTVINIVDNTDLFSYPTDDTIQEYLDDGWKIVSITTHSSPFTTEQRYNITRFFQTFLLEREEDDIDLRPIIK